MESAEIARRRRARLPQALPRYGAAGRPRLRFRIPDTAGHGAPAGQVALVPICRVDGASRNPPNAVGRTGGSMDWWIPARKAPASTLPDYLTPGGCRGTLR